MQAGKTFVKQKASSKAEHLFRNVTSQVPVQWLKISLDFYGISIYTGFEHDRSPHF